MRSGWLKILIRLVVALGFLAVAVAVTAGLWWQGFVTSALKPPQAQVLEIKPGSSFGQAAQQLEKLGVVSDARALTLLARWRGDAGKIHAGEYQFEAAATPAEVLRRLSSGDVRRSQVTIPEGFNLKEIAARLEQAGTGDASEFLALMRDPALLRQQAIDSDSLEGYLFPETYS
ncbi:MAG: endolytic transglycosylase MltG, partial [Desulfuromonadales bacterium]|nr:endolytic transglycosylase MltG [Desulfuromonadales bacterium]